MARVLNGGLEEFKLVDFKKQIKEFFRSKTVLEVNFKESLDSIESAPFKSWISMYNIIDDKDQYILDLVFRNHRSVSIALPKDKLMINSIYLKDKLHIYEARADEGKELLGIGFTVQS